MNVCAWCTEEGGDRNKRAMIFLGILVQHIDIPIMPCRDFKFDFECMFDLFQTIIESIFDVLLEMENVVITLD